MSENGVVTPESASVDYLRPKSENMVERVSRAIYKLRNDDWPFLSDVAAGPEHEFAFEAARAAIAAMREPTREMRRAGLDGMMLLVGAHEKDVADKENADKSDFARGFRTGRLVRNSLETDASYRAMIDAALKDTTP